MKTGENLLRPTNSTEIQKIVKTPSEVFTFDFAPASWALFRSSSTTAWTWACATRSSTEEMSECILKNNFKKQKKKKHERNKKHPTNDNHKKNTETPYIYNKIITCMFLKKTKRQLIVSVPRGQELHGRNARMYFL